MTGVKKMNKEDINWGVLFQNPEDKLLVSVLLNARITGKIATSWDTLYCNLLQMEDCILGSNSRQKMYRLLPEDEGGEEVFEFKEGLVPYKLISSDAVRGIDGKNYWLYENDEPEDYYE